MKLKSLAKKALIVNPTAYGLYAAGGAVNELTGGNTRTYNLAKALKGKGSKNTFSTTTQALSGYQAPAPRQGDWRLPVVNVASAQVVGDVASTAVKEVLAPTADAVSKGLFGVSLKTIAWVAGGSVVGLGGVYVATR